MHHHETLIRLTLCAALLPSLPAAALEQDEASVALVGKVVQAYGGAQAIERAAAVHVQGDIHALVRGESGTYERWLARPRQLRVQTTYPHGSETRILNGHQTWRSGAGGALTEVAGPGGLAMVYQYKQLDLPYGLLKSSYNLRHAGAEDVAGKATEAIEVWDDEGPTMRVNVDTTEHYIVRVSGRITMGAMAMTLAVEFSDYRQVDGMPMPMRMKNYAGATPISETVVTHCVVNPVPDPARFEPPVARHQLARSTSGTGLARASAPAMH